MVREKGAADVLPINSVSAGNFPDWRDQNQVFEGMAIIHHASFNLTGVGEPERINGRRVSANLIRLLGVEPQLGRAFLPEEDAPDAGRVVILSQGLWQRRFGVEPGVTGKPLTLNGQSYTVVGVCPRTFSSPALETSCGSPSPSAPRRLLTAGVTPMKSSGV